MVSGISWSPTRAPSFSYVKLTNAFMKGVDIYENTENPLPLYEAKRRKFVFLLLAQESIG